MKLAVNVPNFGPGTTPDTILAWVRFAEVAGFDLAMMSDHVAVTAEVAGLYPPPFYDPFTTLAWLAGVTERIGLDAVRAARPTPPGDAQRAVMPPSTTNSEPVQ
jgi:hypothetical protein